MGVAERRAREWAERKSQILNAARKLLFEKGLDGTSVNQIAKRAELSPSALYTYFKNKEEIIAALSQEGLDLLHRQAAAEIVSADPPQRRLRQLAGAYWTFSREQREYFDIINHFLISPRPVLNENLKRMVDRQGEKILALGLAAVEEGVGGGIFRDVKPLRFMLMFWAAINGMIHLEKLQNTMLGGEDHQALYWYAVDSLIEGISVSSGR
ncbi:MAG: TetR/AcrR family transcriptional regulator [Pseudomonadota bacterium]